MAFLKNAISSLDPTPDKKKELTLAVNLLFELAEQKNKIQEEAIKNLLRTAGTPENPTIPITSILASQSETRAYVSSDAGSLVTTVTDAIKKFIDGGADNIVNGIGELVTGGLQAILGAGTGAQAEMHSYYIVVEGLSIVRFDVMAWQRRVEAVGITKSIENAMTFTAFKSSVDIDKISFNTFLQAYKKQLQDLDFAPGELKKFIIESKEVFELLRDPGTAPTPAVLADANTLGTRLLMPSTINLLNTNDSIGRRAMSKSVLLNRKTYSFRLSYEVYEDGVFCKKIKTNWAVFFKGHKHGVQPSEAMIHDALIVLTGKVTTWCEHNGIAVPDPIDIQNDYGLETKSAKG